MVTFHVFFHLMYTMFSSFPFYEEVILFIMSLVSHAG